MAHRGDPLGQGSRPIGIPGFRDERGGAGGIPGFSFQQDLGQFDTSTQSIGGAEEAGGLDLAGIGGGLGKVAQGIIGISEGISGLSASRQTEREGKRIRDLIASRARLEFKQRGILARRLLARQRAQFAAAGVAPSGTQGEVQDFTSAQRALERRLILNDALATANRIAREARRRAKRGKRGSILSIISGSAQILAGGAETAGGFGAGGSGGGSAG